MYKRRLSFFSVTQAGGVKTVLDEKNNTLDITLGVGEGVFVIPYCG